MIGVMKIYQTNWYVCILQHTRRVDNWYVYFNVFDRHFSRMLQASCRIYEKLFTELSFEHQIICIPYEYCVMETVEMRWCSTERCTSHWKFSRLCDSLFYFLAFFACSEILNMGCDASHHAAATVLWWKRFMNIRTK